MIAPLPEERRTDALVEAHMTYEDHDERSCPLCEDEREEIYEDHLKYHPDYEPEWCGLCRVK